MDSEFANREVPVPIFQPIVVYKLGGSLLNGAPIQERWPTLIADRIERSVIIAGGGDLVDKLRAQQPLTNMSDADAHWRAIDLLRTSAQILASRLRLPCPVRSIDDLSSRWHQGESHIVLDPKDDLDRDAGRSLPVGWHVTSDSIAGWFALRLRASTLTLIKSRDIPDNVSIDQAVKNGWIDDYFPTIARQLSAIGCAVEWINLRWEGADSLPPVRLTLRVDRAD